MYGQNKFIKNIYYFHVTYFTKCWKINLRTSKLTGFNFLSIRRRANNLPLRSAIVSNFGAYVNLKNLKNIFHSVIYDL